ncbi:MAG: hypothetical protein EBZ48_14975 [Proteobacteria bacterium]|nr:hypothetical protein [Pseudomonadota bacterium]
MFWPDGPVPGSLAHVFLMFALFGISLARGNLVSFGWVLPLILCAPAHKRTVGWMAFLLVITGWSLTFLPLHSFTRSDLLRLLIFTVPQGIGASVGGLLAIYLMELLRLSRVSAPREDPRA